MADVKQITVDKKMIKILSNGPIYPKGGISGPILTPYMEDVRTIFIMITRGVKVVEVLSDNSEVTLTVMNFDSVITPEPPKLKEVELEKTIQQTFVKPATPPPAEKTIPKNTITPDDVETK